ncbi:hypothetical protein ACIBKY_15170 [Nonomuraea sp. NPDC050394]|uniref:hypothetical protein n=1 Tax=Nonomuraea sp. NPDC050394 TaxID=3364363 RepID=UPI0037A23DA0
MTGSWCERPKPPAPPCELPSPFAAPDKPGGWCEVPKSSDAAAVVGFLLRLARR